MISTIVATCMTINWVVGAGALGLPYVMQQAGVVVASTLLVMTTSLLFVTATMLADAFARADGLERLEMLAAEVDVPVSRRTTALACCWRDAAADPPAVPGSRVAAVETSPLRTEGRPGSRAASVSGISLAAMDVDGDGDEGELSSGGYGTAAEGSADSPPGTALVATVPASPHGRELLTPEAARRHAAWLRAPTFLMSRRKIELVELVQRLAGTTAARVYLVLVCAYLYGAMWSYAAVFGQSFVNRFPFSLDDDPEEAKRLSYFAYLAIFGAIAVGLAMFDVREQVNFQLGMTGVRAVVFGSMVITSILGLMSAESNDPRGGFTMSGFEGFDPADLNFTQLAFGALKSLSAASVGIVVPVVVYAQLFHTGTAVLIEPLRDKRTVGVVFGSTYVVTTSVYLVLGVTSAVLFGSSTPSAVQVNWVQYGDAWGNPFAQAVGYIVVLFPGIDTLSVMPLSIVALSSNMMAAVYGDRAPKAERNYWLVRLFRLAAGVPPVIGACISHDLSSILDVAGMVGLFIAFVLPPAAWLLTLRESERFFGPRSDGGSLSRDIAKRLDREAGDASPVEDEAEPLVESSKAVTPYTWRVCARSGCAWCLAIAGGVITLLVVLALSGALGGSAEAEAGSEAMDK